MLDILGSLKEKETPGVLEAVTSGVNLKIVNLTSVEEVQKFQN